jgi:prepilin-type N-terminal cleavage/methylation domain-containing protein
MRTSTSRPSLGADAGFTIIELMVTTLILLVVSGAVMSGVLNMTQLNKTVVNRTSMFAGVRNATALLEQEVGQAGRVSLPGLVKLSGAVAAFTTATVAVTSADNMFQGEQLIIGSGTSAETVALTGVDRDNNTITAAFLYAHNANEPVMTTGAFSSGVVPPSVANGSTDWRLKIFGDIDGTGDMVYVEYFCDIANGRLYRNHSEWDKGKKDPPGVEQILVENVQANPDNTACFVYQTKTVNKVPFVVGVAITLTVQSQEKDPVTQTFQKESKALLNVAPRNVFNAWQLASLDIDNRVQPTPQEITILLPSPTP